MRALNCSIPFVVFGFIVLSLAGCKGSSSSQMRFASPEDAATTLHEAFKSQDNKKIEEIFGRDGLEAVESGDPVSDRNVRQVIALALEESTRWEPRGADSKELIIGDEQWPFPVPLVKVGSKWQFDSEAGKEEVLARRIGANELGVIDVCRAYVEMQKEYASQAHDGKPKGLFAQHLQSSPGRHDGLYWPTKPGEMRSPLGDLAAQAAVEGYDPKRPESSPFWGYQFRVLTSQGAAATGGKKDYTTKGEMRGGFALVAYPAKYAYSGVMTFIVGQDGVVYQKDLGERTDFLAMNMSEYNPDSSWSAVNRSESLF